MIVKLLFCIKNIKKKKKIRDSVARVRHMYWLENEMKKGTKLTEKSIAKELEKIQRFHLKNIGLFCFINFSLLC